MSNLIPTPIIDKRGRQTTVHKKPVTAETKLRAMPVPSLPAAEVSPLDDLTDLLSADGEVASKVPDLRMILEMINKDHAESVSLFIRLLASGTEAARDRALGVIKTNLIDIQDAFDSFRHGESGSPNWWEDCIDSWHPTADSNVLRAWHTMTVIEEADNGVNANDVFYQISDLEIMFTAVDPRFQNYPTEDGFWRGVAALAMCEEAPYKEEDSTLKKFIEWAGNHDDVRKVIGVAKERDTIRVDVLEDILSRQDANSPVREGLL